MTVKSLLYNETAEFRIALCTIISDAMISEILDAVHYLDTSYAAFYTAMTTKQDMDSAAVRYELKNTLVCIKCGVYPSEKCNSEFSCTLFETQFKGGTYIHCKFEGYQHNCGS